MTELVAPRPKRRLGMAAAPLPRRERIAAVSRALMTMEAGALAEALGARDVEQPLKSTVSLCPDCLAYVPALVFRRAGSVWMAKRCPCLLYTSRCV